MKVSLTKSKLFQIAKFIFVIAIIIYVIRENGGSRLLETMAQAQPGWLILSALSFFLSILLGSSQWFLLLRFQGVVYPFWRCFRIYYLGLFTNALIFNLAGDALRIYKLKKAQTDLTKGFVATFLDRFIGFSVLSFFSLLAIITIKYQNELNTETIKLIFYCSFGVFSIFSVGTLILNSRTIGKLFLDLFKMMRLKKIEKYYIEVQGCLYFYRSHWKGMLVVGFISCSIHSLRILGHFFCAPALGIDLSLVYFFAFIPIVSLIALIPLNLGGWGLPQGIGVVLYGFTGVITAIQGNSLITEEALKVAAGSLTFLPSIIFYLIMLMGGFFVSSHLEDNFTNSKKE